MITDDYGGAVHCIKDDYREPNPSDMVIIGSVDFKEHVEIFEMLRFAEYSGNISKDNIIFDEDGHTLWVVWDTK